MRGLASFVILRSIIMSMQRDQIIRGGLEVEVDEVELELEVS